MKLLSTSLLLAAYAGVANAEISPIIAKVTIRSFTISVTHVSIGKH